MDSGDFSILDTDDISVPYIDVDIDHLYSHPSNTQAVAKSGKRKFESDSSSSDESDETAFSSVDLCTHLSVDNKLAAHSNLASDDRCDLKTDDLSVQYNVNVEPLCDSKQQGIQEATLCKQGCDSENSSSSFNSISPLIEQQYVACLHKNNDEINVDFESDTILHRLTFNWETNKLLQYLDSCPALKLYDLINRRNQMGKTALHLAALLPDSQIIEFLLYAGADPGIQDTLGRTILHILAEIGTAEIVAAETLTNLSEISELKDSYVEYSGGSYRLTDIPNNGGFTALHIATLNNDTSMVDFLLLLGARPGTADRKSGRTALHCAAEAGNLELVRVLTEGREIDIEAKTYNGQTALVVAYHRGHSRVVHFLRQIGAVYDPTVIKQYGPIRGKSQRTN